MQELSWLGKAKRIKPVKSRYFINITSLICRRGIRNADADSLRLHLQIYLRDEQNVYEDWLISHSKK